MAGLSSFKAPPMEPRLTTHSPFVYISFKYAISGKEVLVKMNVPGCANAEYFGQPAIQGFFRAKLALGEDVVVKVVNLAEGQPVLAGMRLDIVIVKKDDDQWQ